MQKKKHEFERVLFTRIHVLRISVNRGKHLSIIICNFHGEQRINHALF
ncbi:MAG: hypothetical protein ACI9LM_003749 [Alteromonadaceae bacterium]|jgi:hypothetical protein